jgi:hypothetical protein
MECMEGQAFERLVADLLKSDFQPISGPDSGFDFVSRDGTRIVQAKLALQSGSRDLRAAIVNLATAIVDHPRVTQAILLIRVGRLSAARALDEWRQTKTILKSNIANRLALVLLAPDKDAIEPDTPELRKFAAKAAAALNLPPSDVRHRHREIAWSGVILEVWKVIFSAWLRCEPPLPIGEIKRRSGTSYPTVAATLQLLEERHEIERLSNRSVTLRAFPRTSLGELVVLGRSVRFTSFLRDRAERDPDPVKLLRRLQRKLPKGVALGGVVAARYYDPDFDLNGTPRLDVTITRATSLLPWWRDTDPALESAPAGEPGVVMVAHGLLRPEDQFVKVPEQALPLADPAEVVLDLYELRLEEQAEHLVATLRKRCSHV